MVMNKRFRILLAIDLHSGTDSLVAEAQRYAQALAAIVDIIHIVPPDPFVGYIKQFPVESVDSTRELHARDLRAEHQQVQAVGARLRQSGVDVDRSLTIQGPLPTALFDQVNKFDSSLLILGSHHHRALYRLWYGDIAVDAVKQAPCTLLVVPL
jgi:nucleotide-binding universal stress UspA family protein